MTYGCPDSLHKTLASLVDQVDSIAIVDGPFTGWPRLPKDYELFHPPQRCDFCSQLGVPIAYRSHLHVKQKTARTLGLQIAEFGSPDWVLIIDDDETLSVSGVDLRSKLGEDLGRYAAVDVWNRRFNQTFPQNRLVRWKRGLHYEPNHWTIVDEMGEVCKNATPPFPMVDKGVVIVNDPDLRPRSWELHRSLYRLLQFIVTETSWESSSYFTGADEGAEFFDQNTVEEKLEAIKLRAAKGDDFAYGLLTELASINNGSKSDIQRFDQKTRGAIAAILYAAGVIPWPYVNAKEETADSKVAEK